MHLTEGEIRACLDQELEATSGERHAAHLQSCPRCQARAQVLNDRRQQIEERFSALDELPGQIHQSDEQTYRSDGQTHRSATTSPQAARRKLAARLDSRDNKERETMWNKMTSRRARPVWTALALVAVLAIALSFPSVRAAAGSFLGLFRVEQIRVVQVDPEQFSGQMESSSQLESLMSDAVQFEPAGEIQEVDSAALASQLAGFPVRLTEGLETTPKFTVQPGGTATMTVDLELVRAVLKDLERPDIELPDELDGAQVVVTVPAGVGASYGNCPILEEGIELDAPQGKPVKWDCTVLLQMPSPTISAPPGLDIEQIGEAYLQLLGMSPEEAASFASNVDWTTTFVIPIPRYGVEYSEVTVDGVTGLLVENYEGASLLWVKDGVIYSLSGVDNAEKALELANQLK